MTVKQIKQQEARTRMSDLAAARKSKSAAARIQRKNALIRDADKSEILNFKEVMDVFARWG